MCLLWKTNKQEKTNNQESKIKMKKPKKHLIFMLIRKLVNMLNVMSKLR